MKTILIHNITPDLRIPIVDFVDGTGSVLIVEQSDGEFEAFRRSSAMVYNHYPTGSTFVPNEVVPTLEIDAAELMTGVENEQEDARLFEQWNLGDWLSSYPMSCVSSFRTRLRNNRNPEADQVGVSPSELPQSRSDNARAEAARWSGTFTTREPVWTVSQSSTAFSVGEEVRLSGTRSEGRDRPTTGRHPTEAFAEYAERIREERRQMFNAINGRNAQGY